MFNDLKLIRRQFLRSHRLYTQAQNSVATLMVGAWNNAKKLALIMENVPPSPVKQILANRIQELQLDKSSKCK